MCLKFDSKFLILPLQILSDPHEHCIGVVTVRFFGLTESHIGHT